MKTLAQYRSAACALVAFGAFLGWDVLSADEKADRKEARENRKANQAADKAAISADPFQQKLAALSLDQLKALRATEQAAYDAWRQKYHINLNCQLRNIGSTPEVEAQWTAQCVRWKSQLRAIDSAIFNREKQDREAFRTQLESLPLDELRKLHESERAAYRKWRADNHILGSCQISNRQVTRQTPQQSAAIIAQCEEWNDKLGVIDRTLNRRTNAAAQ